MYKRFSWLLICLLVALSAFCVGCPKDKYYYDATKGKGVVDMSEGVEIGVGECSVDSDCQQLLNANASCGNGVCSYLCNDGWSDFGGVLEVDGCLCDKSKSSCSDRTVCGDGFKEGGENCDAGVLNSNSCAYGEMSCQVCDLNCVSRDGDVLGYCGDGEVQVDFDEDCDGESVELACLDVGKTYGKPRCLSTCKGDYLNCLKVVSITQSFFKTCVVVDSGNLRCWGKGPLGNGFSEDSVYPLDVVGLYGYVKKVITNKGYSCLLNDSGEVWCWGLVGTDVNVSSKRVLKVDVDNVVDISVGEDFACAIVVGNFVKCWGYNKASKFLGHSGDFYYTPVIIDAVSQTESISSGDEHTCAVLLDGRVRCWGGGRLGSSESGDNVIVEGITSAKAVFVQNDSSCVILRGEDVFCWGDNLGYFGDGAGSLNSKVVYTKPRQIMALKGTEKIAFGSDHMCILRDGEVLCAGENDFGQLGDGTTDPSSFHVKVKGITDAVDIAAGFKSTCAVLQSGPVKCWGYNVDGFLGDGTNMTQLLPVDVKWQ